MITGFVSAGRKPLLPLRVRGPGGTTLDVTVVMDTGFTGILALPAAVIAKLGLHPTIDSVYELADGTPVTIPQYQAEVEWGPTWLSIRALAIGREPLLGMRLLDGHRVYMEVVTGGLVDIVALP